MKIMFLNAEDLAGVTYNFAKAINKYTKHEADQIVTTTVSVMENPAMHHFNNEDKKELRRLIYDSDAIVFHEWMGIPTVMKLDMEKLRYKILAVTLGGAGFRKPKFRRHCMEYYGKISDNVKYIIHSPDFSEAKPEWPWVPRCLAIDELREKYDYAKSEPPLVVTSPHPQSDGVNSAMGNVSDIFKKAVSRLSSRGFKFKDCCISTYQGGVDNDTCLRLKAPASIFFDRIYKVFGMNSIEASAFESAVVTGTSQFTLDKIKQSTGTECPFIIVNSWGDVEAAFAKLISNPEYRRRKGLECYRYAETVHSGKLSAERLVRILGS